MKKWSHTFWDGKSVKENATVQENMQKNIL